MPKRRAVTTQLEHTGMLSLSEGHDRELRRTLRSAYLRCQNTGDDILPALSNAVVLWIGDRQMTITRFEQDAITCRVVERSWYVEYGPEFSDRAV
jgi:hypothetical protein